MWIMMTDGFVSIVNDQNDHSRVQVRARKRQHLVDLLGEKAEILHTPTADYYWRSMVKREDIAEIVAVRIASIDYGNFKAATAAKDPELAHAYSGVWSEMYDYQRLQNSLHKYGYGKRT